MKNKTKIIVSAALLLGLTVAATSTASLAWFTATRTAQASLSDLVVANDTSSLTVALVPGTLGDNLFGVADNGSTNNNIKLQRATDATLKDVSGDGVSLNKPSWKPGLAPTATTAGVADTFTAAAKATQYVEFQLKFSMGTDANMSGIAVYLGQDDAGTPQFNSFVKPGAAGDSVETDDVAAANSARIAILNEARDTLIALWNPNGATGTDDYIEYMNGVADVDGGMVVAGSGTAYGVNGYTLATPASLGTKYIAGALERTASTSDATKNTIQIASLTPSANEVTLTFRIWLEGQDKDMTNTADKGVFITSLGFYGI